MRTSVLKKSLLPILVAGALCSGAHAGGLFQPYMNIKIPAGNLNDSVAIGDVNGDGRNDVVMTGYPYSLYVYLQNEGGTLAPATTYTIQNYYPSTVGIADMNGDGRNDIVLGGQYSNIEVFMQNTNGLLNPSVNYLTVYSNKIRLADFNNDGIIDVVGVDHLSDYVGVFFGSSSGSLGSAVTYFAPHGGFNDLEAGDVNGDGLTDIVLSSDQGGGPYLKVLTQNPLGGFYPVNSYDVSPVTSINGIGIGDVNGDGRSDVIASYGGNSPSTYIGLLLQDTGGGLITPSISMKSYDIPDAVELHDMNLDGRQDVVVLHDAWTKAGVYLQQADGTLASEELYFIPYGNYGPHGLALGDINSDGLPDIVIADSNISGLVILYGNHAPVSDNQSVVTSEDVSLPVVLSGSDVDGNSLLYTVVSNPANGALTGTAPNLTYSPNANFNGEDSFTFKTNDGADSNIATVYVSVASVNDAPVATADRGSTQAGRSVSLGVLANDTDVDGDVLTLTAVSPALYGTATITRDKLKIRYVPNAGFSGTDTFTYTVSDGKGGIATATVSVKVNTAALN